MLPAGFEPGVSVGNPYSWPEDGRSQHAHPWIFDEAPQLPLTSKAIETCRNGSQIDRRASARLGGRSHPTTNEGPFLGRLSTVPQPRQGGRPVENPASRFSVLSTSRGPAPSSSRP